MKNNDLWIKVEISFKITITSWFLQRSTYLVGVQDSVSGKSALKSKWTLFDHIALLEEW